MIDQSGDNFVALVWPLLPELQNAARRRWGDTAEDLVQDVLLFAWRARGSFQDGTNVRAWLFAILHSRGVDAHRSNRRRAAAEQRARENPHPRQPEREDLALDLEQLGDGVVAGLASLRPDWRRAFLLAVVDELSCEQVAAAVGCPVGSVKSRMWRCRRAVRETALREEPRS